MFPNPFTPIFGGKPDFFFGRKEILRRFRTAMVDRGGEYRSLFLTGSRGYGKTAVLEQLSNMAGRSGWRVVDIGSDRPVETVVRRLAGASERSRTIDPSLSVSFLGTGVGAGGVSRSSTTRFGREDLGTLVLDACKREKRGLMLTIDEIQKIDLDDVSAICDAFQMASRKGYDVMLAVAGLPYAHGKVIQHEGCTYLRRSVHKRLGPLSRDDVRGAFESAFDSIAGLKVQDDAFELLVEGSKGHPYIMQLLGYYVVEGANEETGESEAHVGLGGAKTAFDRAMDAYASRAVGPMVDALPALEVDYLRAMSKCLDTGRLAKTGDIARTLGKTSQQLSRSRQHLIDHGIIIAVRHGEVMFGIPYVDDYLLNRADEDDELASRLEWGY